MGAWAGSQQNTDPFSRLRVSNPTTLFDSKLTYDAQPLLWDDAVLSGTGTSSTHSVDRASVTLGVSNTTAGSRARQTKRRFRYEPGKGQLAYLTFTMGVSGSGITHRVGLFDANNGVFFQQVAGALSIVKRSHITGSPVDTTVAQASWSVDPLDGTGPSRVTLDPTKSQLLVIDYQWLGIGAVRVGFVVDGQIHYAHQFNTANRQSGVWASTADLPARYEITNSGAGPASTLEHICCSVMSEGGLETVGNVIGVNTGTTALTASSIGTTYACIGLRLKTTHLGVSVVLIDIDMTSTSTNDVFLWQLLMNPTVASTFTYAAITNTALEAAIGVTANTVTGGTVIESGYAPSRTQVSIDIGNLIRLGATIAGTRDEMVLTVTPVVGTNQSVLSSLTWRELL